MENQWNSNEDVLEMVKRLIRRENEDPVRYEMLNDDDDDDDGNNDSTPTSHVDKAVKSDVIQLDVKGGAGDVAGAADHTAAHSGMEADLEDDESFAMQYELGAMIADMPHQVRTQTLVHT